ncbi:XRE family transcriptional regulator [Listeria monocytogenes]|nr:XRE family transcriptional regulator [Listeria monocytogenes]
MTIVDRIKSLCHKRDISLNDLENELNFGKNSIYRWKERNPSIDKVDKVASYFNVSTDFLLGRTDNIQITSEENQESNEEFITFFRANTSDLTEEKKQLLEDELMAFMEARRKFLDGKGK